MREERDSDSITTEISNAQKKMEDLEYEEVAKILNNIIERYPLSDRAHRLVGEILLQVGLDMDHLPSIERALHYFEKSVKLNPKESINWTVLAHYYKKRDNPQKAITVLLQALNFVENKESIYLEILSLHEILQNTDALLGSLQQLIVIAPENLSYKHRYAKQLKEIGKEKEAFDLYWQIMNSGRKDIPTEAVSNWLDLMNNYAECLTDIRQSVEDIYHLNPGHSMIKLLYAKVCIARGEIEQGENLLKEIGETSPDDIGILLRLANTYASIGASEKSERYLADALRIDPNSIDIITANTTKHSCNYGDRTFEQIMLAEARLADLSKEEQIHLHYALGKVYDSLGELDVAFEHYKRGGILEAEGKYLLDIEHLSKYTDFITNYFTHFSERASRSNGCSSDKPIFIVGMPRSGTSLLEQVLASNNGIYGAGELKYFARVLGHMEIEGKRLPFDVKESCFSENETVTFAQRGERYVQMCEMLAPKENLHIVDKMPDNFKWLGFIHLLLPHAKIIHARRHPVEICLSAYRINFSDGMHWSSDLKSLGKRYRLYHELMQFWQKVLPKNTILNVRYEDMVTDLEGESKRIMTYIGMEWQPECLKFHSAKRAVRTASIGQVHQPIYKTSINRWHRYKPWLKPLLDEIGDLVEAYEAEL